MINDKQKESVECLKNRLEMDRDAITILLDELLEEQKKTNEILKKIDKQTPADL